MRGIRGSGGAARAVSAGCVSPRSSTRWPTPPLLSPRSMRRYPSASDTSRSVPGPGAKGFAASRRHVCCARVRRATCRRCRCPERSYADVTAQWLDRTASGRSCFEYRAARWARLAQNGRPGRRAPGGISYHACDYVSYEQAACLLNRSLGAHSRQERLGDCLPQLTAFFPASLSAHWLLGLALCSRDECGAIRAPRALTSLVSRSPFARTRRGWRACTSPRRR